MKLIYFGFLLASAFISQTQIGNYEQVTNSINQHVAQYYPKEDMGSIYIVVSVPKQKLYLVKNSRVVSTYPISTSKNGVGNISGSLQTPLGLHKIVTKLGNNAEIGTIIKKGIVLNEKTEIITEHKSINTDIIITRAMWLTGLEAGKNLGGNVDSLTRGIMIHGTPEEGLIGEPASHGCIRMKNKDVVELFNKVPNGTKVVIENEF